MTTTKKIAETAAPKTIDTKAERNAYAEACNTLGLAVCEVPCLVYSTEPGGDPVVWTEGRIYEFFAVSEGYVIPSGEPVVGVPPKVRYSVPGGPKIAMHWRKG